MKNILLVALGLAFLALLWTLLKRMTTVTAKPPTAAQAAVAAAGKYAKEVATGTGTYFSGDTMSVDEIKKYFQVK